MTPDGRLRSIKPSTQTYTTQGKADQTGEALIASGKGTAPLYAVRSVRGALNARDTLSNTAPDAAEGCYSALLIGM